MTDTSEDTNKTPLHEKTWGREVAFGMLAFWGGLTGWFFFGQTNPEMVKAFAPAYSTMTLAVFGLVTGIFGVARVVKGYSRRPRTEGR